MRKKGVFEKVYQLVIRIPKGKVVTYGDLARALKISDSRVIGWALHGNKNPKVPCHRVINKRGELSKGYVFGGWGKQKEKLVKEGVIFKDEKSIDLEKSVQKIHSGNW